MELYVFRHGHAPPLAGADFDRALDEKGCAEVVSSANLLLGIPFDLLVCSPLVRAVQTAALIQRTIGFSAQIQVWPEAAPDGKISNLLDRLKKSEREQIILVSHQPLVSNLVDHLSGERIYMDTATVLGLHMDIIDVGCADIIFRGLK